MGHSLRQRFLCALTAISVALLAAPVPLMAGSPEGRVLACSMSETAVSPVSHDGRPAEIASAAVSGGNLHTAGLHTGGLSCEPGGCSMPLTMCMGAGACASVASLPALASPLPSWDVHVAPTLPTDHGIPSPSSRHPTPPPRG